MGLDLSKTLGFYSLAEVASAWGEPVKRLLELATLGHLTLSISHPSQLPIRWGMVQDFDSPHSFRRYDPDHYRYYSGIFDLFPEDIIHLSRASGEETGIWITSFKYYEEMVLGDLIRYRNGQIVAIGEHANGEGICISRTDLVLRVKERQRFEEKLTALEPAPEPAVNKVSLTENDAVEPPPTPNPVKARKLTSRQRHREEARAVAQRIWALEPSITIEEMSKRQGIATNAQERSRGVTQDTLKNWIRDLAPDRKPGRRPTKPKT